MMATDIKHQPFVLSANTMANNHNTSDLNNLGPKLMVVNEDMTRDLRQMTPRLSCHANNNNNTLLPKSLLSSSSWENSKGLVSEGLTMMKKKLETTTTTGGATTSSLSTTTTTLPYRQLGTPTTSSISEDSDLGPTYVNSQDIITNTNHGNGNNPGSPVARPLRRRCQSTPTSGSRQRRTIFDSFWKKEDSFVSSATGGSKSNGGGGGGDGGGDADSDTMSAASSTRSRNSSRNNNIGARRGRANSICAVPNSPPQAPPPLDENSDYYCNNSSSSSVTRDSINIMMFSPPVEHKSVIMSRFEGLQELPEDILLNLPPLPSPLSRTYRNDGSAECKGVYPLVSPRSILQKSSYRPETSQMVEDDEDDDDNDVSSEHSSSGKLSPLNGGEFRKSAKGTSMVMPLPLALTTSIHLNNNGRPNLVVDGTASSTDESSSSTQSTGRQRIHFDPRVTITEYSDEVPREWYSDEELDKFKFETINIAQHYLRSHPELVPEYCAGLVNPVTGVTKKKALYSLPILNDVTIEEGESSEVSTTTAATTSQTSTTKPLLLYDYAKMARIHVRKILIVDPNKLILDLFCRSLRQIFPEAELTPVQTGDEALQRMKQLYKDALSQSTVPRSFDLIIIEERLHALPLRGFGHSPRLSTTQTKGGNSSRSLAKAKHNSMTQLAEYNKATMASSTIDSFHPTVISGSEVVGRIKQLEAEYCRPDRCIREEDDYDGYGEDPSSSQREQVCWKSLLIGVCVDQRFDTLKLWQAGADLVWGKPPPPMGENLRNTLVTMLVRKRSPATLN